MMRMDRAMLAATMVAATMVTGAGCGDDDVEPPDAGGDTVAPTIQNTYPLDGDSVWLHETFSVELSEAIDPATVTAAAVVVTVDATPITTTVTLEDRTLRVRLADDAAAIGTMTMVVGSGVADLAGNPMAATTLTFAVPAWIGKGDYFASGPAGDGATVAVADDGALAVLWGVTSEEGRIVYIDDALDTGPVLRTTIPADATGVTLALDGESRPVLAWSTATGAAGAPPVITVVRWDGTTWAPLPSPGAGTAPTLARQGDALAIAWIVPDPGTDTGAQTIALRSLVGDVWQPLAEDVVVGGEIVDGPVLALPAADRPALAFIEAGGVVSPGGAAVTSTVRVLAWQTAWVEPPGRVLPAVPTGQGGNRVALAASGDDVYVAWDEHDGSFGTHVAAVGADGWTLLGHALDVDPPADARAPALAIDADGAPVVAWTELIESTHRGFLARWSGDAWETVGGDAWNNDTNRAAERPALAMWKGRVPVVAWTTSVVGNGDVNLQMARWNGPATARFGRDARASMAGCSVGDGNPEVPPPATLSATGCFTIVNSAVDAHPGLVPYDLISELWSDGAHKRRWLGVVDGGTLDTPAVGAWSAPVGSIIVKEFAVELTPGDPRSRRPVETRFLVHGEGGWIGYNYQWRADGTDADLLAGEIPTEVAWTLSNGTTHTHSYPSRAQCLRCHTDDTSPDVETFGPLLGVRAGQLQRWYDYDGVAADQLATFAHLGLMAPASAPGDRYAAPHDASESLERRVRGYLAANCAHCHSSPTGEAAFRDFRWELPLADTTLCEGEVVIGDPAASMIVQRTSTRPLGGMPPLATLQNDPVLQDLLSRWITGMTSCP